MFSYTPMTEDQCEKERQFPLLEPGVYDFKVIEAKAQNSSSGNPMIALELRIITKEGVEFNVFDYLVATAKMMWKTKHFCDTVGLANEYMDGSFTEKYCLGRNGKAMVVYQEGKKKPDGNGYYKDKNAIEDYVMSDKGAMMHTSLGAMGSKATASDLNDDIKF